MPGNVIAMTNHTTPSTSERVTAAFAANGLTWESPVVDLIDALIFDGDFTAEDADTIVMRGVAR